MENRFPGPLSILLLIFTTTVCVLGLRKQFHVVEIAKSWQEARDYCRSRYTDLATIRNLEEDDYLLQLTLKNDVRSFWIGLHRDTTDPAHWTWTELADTPLLTGEYANWLNEFEPQNKNCTILKMNENLWYTEACSQYYNPFCNIKESVHPVDEVMTWEEAQQLCKNNYQGPAIITKETVMPDTAVGYIAWLGLFRDGDEVWKWAGETQSDFRNWAPGQPDNQDCAQAYLNTTDSSTILKWFSNPCLDQNIFVCYEETLILVKENKTWEEALEFCRSLAVDLSVDPTAYNNHRYDLASLLSDDDHLYAGEKIQAAMTDQVWTGLRFLAGQWLWVNGERLQYQDLPLCPAQWQHCGTLPKDGARPWGVRDCNERRNFLCIKRDVGQELEQGLVPVEGEGEGLLSVEGEGALLVEGEGEGALLVEGEGEGALLVDGEGEGALLVEGEGEGEGALLVDGEGALLVEGEGEGALLVDGEGEGALLVDGEGEGALLVEGEGEGALLVEGEGEGALLVDGEGALLVEGEGEGALLVDGEGEGALLVEGEGEGALLVDGEGEGALLVEGEGEGALLVEAEGEGNGNGNSNGNG